MLDEAAAQGRARRIIAQPNKSRLERLARRQQIDARPSRPLLAAPGSRKGRAGLRRAKTNRHHRRPWSWSPPATSTTRSASRSAPIQGCSTPGSGRSFARSAGEARCSRQGAPAKTAPASYPRWPAGDRRALLPATLSGLRASLRLAALAAAREDFDGGCRTALPTVALRTR